MTSLFHSTSLAIALLSGNAPDLPMIRVLTPDEVAEEKFRCNALEPGYREIVPSQKIIRPGNTISFQVGAQTGVFGFKQFPEDCLFGWRAEPSEFATFDAQTKRLKISDNTPGNTQITVSVIFDGTIIKRDIKITGLHEVVLTGTRSLKEGPDCTGSDHVGEIDFKDNGRFGVTFQPFERYVDYWGTYSFDSKTGALEMKADGGNFVPANIDLSGKAWFEPNGLLHLDGFNLGGRSGYVPLPPVPGERYEAPPACRYIFYAG